MHVGVGVARRGLADCGRQQVAVVTCEDCGKQVSSRAATCPECGAPVQKPVEHSPDPDKPVKKPRSVGVLLGFFILLVPFIFAWFTLRRGHTRLSRVVSFGWLVAC